MFCALLGHDIRRVFAGPLVLWFKYSLHELKVMMILDDTDLLSLTPRAFKTSKFPFLSIGYSLHIII